MSNPLICEIFRSPRREGMYLYVKRSEGLEHVPETLLKAFGKPEPAMVITLGRERKLARVDATAVLAALEDDGYFLQMPPSPFEQARQERTLGERGEAGNTGDDAC